MTFPFSRSTNAEDGSEAKAGSSRAFFWELLQVVAISLAIVVPIRYFVAAPFYVKGASMEPNFYDHEYLIIDEMGYRFHAPARGDIVVFRYPRDPSQFFIKRVIGLPNETVEITDNHVRIYNNASPNGQLLDESAYLESSVPTVGNKRVTLKPDEYFLLGDNRMASRDSRDFGAVKESAFVGRVWFRGLPPERWTVFHTPSYPKP